MNASTSIGSCSGSAAAASSSACEGASISSSMPSMVIRPSAAFIVDSRCTSVHSAFGCRPPKPPECASVAAVCTTRSKLAVPRLPNSTIGRPEWWTGPSAVMTMSTDRSSSTFSATNDDMCGLPISSSPSSTTITFTGSSSSPWTSSHDSIARSCARCWP